MNNQKKTPTIISWDDYFMSVVYLTTLRSKDPILQVGAVIVGSDNRIISTGYNGRVPGISNDQIPWNNPDEPYLDSKLPYIIHAEQNAVFNADIAKMKDSTIYVNIFPCLECARFLVKVQLKKLIYLEDATSTEFPYLKSWAKSFAVSKKILLANGITIKKLENFQFPTKK